MAGDAGWLGMPPRLSEGFGVVTELFVCLFRGFKQGNLGSKNLALTSPFVCQSKTQERYLNWLQGIGVACELILL